MPLIETTRLVLDKLEQGDSAFIRALLNDPDWIRFIGDRNIHSDKDAITYIENGPMKSYALNGFGLYRVSLRDTGIPIGISGLIKRTELEDVDIGYAFLKEFRGKGYALEAAIAVLNFGQKEIGLRRIVAITTADNDDSCQLLKKAGLHFERMIRLNADEAENKLFAVDFEP